MEDEVNDLQCPVTLDLLEDPVASPCCGRTFSRAALRSCLERTDTCPVCRACVSSEYPSFDVNTIPKLKVVASMVERHRQKGGVQDEEKGKEKEEDHGVVVEEEETKDKEAEFRCSFQPIQNRLGEKLSVGKLSLDVVWPDYRGDISLFIPIIDRSGSMMRSFSQVQEALLYMHFLTFQNRHVFTCMIPYETKSEIIMVPRDGDTTTERARAVENTIRTMRAGGGTNFESAFDALRTVLVGGKDHKGVKKNGAPEPVTTAVVVFMTDGQDNRFRGGKSQELLKMFKMYTKKWKKKLIVHTIGFSSSHDFNFLNNLRKMGDEDGLFRYAEPTDSGDALCTKLSDLASSIMDSSCLSAKIRTPFQVRGGENREVEVKDEETGEMKKMYEMTTPLNLDEGVGSLDLYVDSAKLSSLGEGEELNIQLEVQNRTWNIPIRKAEKGEEENEEGDDSAKEYQAWLAHLVQEVILEAAGLARVKEKKTDQFRLHASFILRRAQALEVHVRKEAVLMNRLMICIQQLQAVLKGGEVSLARLNDVIDSRGKLSAPPATPSPTTPSPAASSSSSSSRKGKAPALVEDFSRAIRPDGVISGLSERNKVHEALINSDAKVVSELAFSNPQLCIGIDEAGNTPLHYCAAMGRLNCVKDLLEAEPEVLNQSNKQLQTPLELAIRGGYWKMVELLIKRGGIINPRRDANQLFRDVVMCRFFNTAGRMVSYKIATVEVSLLKQSVPAVTLEWIMQKQAEIALGADLDSDDDSSPSPSSPSSSSSSSPSSSPENATLYLKSAVENGILNLVKKLLETTSPLLTIDLLFACGPNGDNGADVAEELLKTGKLDADEPGPDNETALFRAAEKGWLPLLQVLLAHGADPNKQNEKGTSPLYIACSNRNLECITELLSAGADPNLPNNKGDVPLTAAAYRNMCSGVAALLTAGAKIDQGRDDVNSPLLSCCRLGHDVILGRLLAKLLKEKNGAERVHKELNIYAQIDGFTPLLAATEQNFPECIRVLAQYDPNLDQLTKDDNPILGHATPLHIAAQYGCLEAAAALLELGAKPGIPDATGKTPLHIAVMQSNALLVRLLLTYKASLSQKDNDGHTAAYYSVSQEISEELSDPVVAPLLGCIRSGKLTEEVERILRYSCDMPGCLTARDLLDVDCGDGRTPLLESVISGNTKFSHLLVEIGCDYAKPDSLGLSPLVWSAILGQDAEEVFGREVVPTENDKEKLEKLEEQRKDFRNRLVLDFDASLFSSSSSPSSSSVMDSFDLRMADGVDSTTSSSLSDLPSSRGTFSVLPFFENISGNGRVWEENFDLRGMMEAAKNFSVGKILSPKENGLSLQQFFALYLFSSSPEILRMMNGGVREGGERGKSWAPYLNFMNLTLKNLPIFEGEVYRGVNKKFTKDDFAIGKTIVWNSFSVCTQKWQILISSPSSSPSTSSSSSSSSSTSPSSFRHNIIFLIKSKTGRQISQFSSQPQNFQVVFAPNTKFTITNWYIADVVAFGQANIRSTTYKVYDSFLKKATKKDAPIFIELTEN